MITAFSTQIVKANDCASEEAVGWSTQRPQKAPTMTAIRTPAATSSRAVPGQVCRVRWNSNKKRRNLVCPRRTRKYRAAMAEFSSSQPKFQASLKFSWANRKVYINKTALHRRRTEVTRASASSRARDRASKCH